MTKHLVTPVETPVEDWLISGVEPRSVFYTISLGQLAAGEVPRGTLVFKKADVTFTLDATELIDDEPVPTSAVTVVAESVVAPGASEVVAVAFSSGCVDPARLITPDGFVLDNANRESLRAAGIRLFTKEVSI